ncbi:DNA polymerase III subunit gamma and tau [Pseudarthrobacter phenanthrenivorans]|uniref:DNA polymerase III subunit gamma/tau n=1 Tax=Pseudarthrobacter phenanthrenivorans TaxID=361575 RepID=A0A3B0F677_PSEPS|nr:DNA polymerase III subunit gamma and tau [Pseudarthrobacter phenanthrenivorans]RKO22386.1 DNA polymerase III subunit gamma and tau [Pseudarthrobacter phenanthrenivorans]
MSARIGRVFSVTVTTALYRRYRPDSFADVIGQEHVTGPLMTALRKNRVNHAYLFSGPRGCGKTTSARILARCLNCAQGPTDTPCGTCPSCIELARGGSGSLDVIEIDAASHGGVDDARDLRERATYAPVRDRYKIFIIDEAHMVTSAGFNALLKIVEEPPEHIKFIFATTEPDKVIGTIRSRTHHYPFRLVPPEPLMAYLELLCSQENVPVAPGVLSLVIRAGGGSVRDSLSVLDQLMAGAGPNGLDYELAVALLGYTHASLLDDVVEAVAASDAATVFRAVDRVIQTGHDPRRFVEDLLERFRDLIIVQAMPESAQTILRGMPADQIARLQNQAHNLGAAELSRAADVTNTALTEMTGATSPRLHLELLCARILLPSSEQNERGIAARIDRVERRLNYAGNDVGAPAAPASAAAGTAPAGAAAASAAPAGSPERRAGERPPAPPLPDGTTGPAVPAAAVPAAPVPAAAAAGDVQHVKAPGAASTVSAAQNASPAPGASPASTAHGPAAAEAPTLAQGAQPGPASPAVPPVSAPHPAPTAARDASSAADGTRAPLTAPRVSTDDWPVDESAGNRPSAAAPVPSPARDHDSVAPRRNEAPGGMEQQSRAASGAAQAPAARQSTAPPSETSAQSAGPSVPSPGTAPGTAAVPAPGVMGDVEVLRRAWPDVLQTLSKIKRSTWALVEPNAQVAAFDGQILTLAFTTSGLAGAFGRADHSENLRQAIHKTVGIDCQINATANGASTQTSSDPNPKVPASPAAPATSADVAWGLAPAPAPSPDDAAQQPGPGVGARQPGVAIGSNAARREGSPAGPAVQQRQDLRSAQEHVGQPRQASADHAAVPAAAHRDLAAKVGQSRPEAQPAPTVPASATAVPAPAAFAPEGDYSYSDDDWGPARDEDAPPLDEEPPMDWKPSPQSQSQPQPKSQSQPEVQQADPAPSANAEPAGSGRAGGRPAGAPHDPWTRAVEQAPGVWVVGEESNVGRTATAALSDETPAAPVPAPRYEPAAAQVPPSIPVTASGSRPEPDWGLATAAAAAPSPDGGRPGPGAPVPGVASSEPVREPEFAMASAMSAPAAAPSQTGPAVGPATQAGRPAASAAASTPAAPPAVTAVPAKADPAASAAAETRQSLYQRLSNSPEAEAGRAKAPARAVAAAATYVQDIPSADDETIEESGVFGRAAVERILGGKLIEERSPDGSPLAPRY